MRNLSNQAKVYVLGILLAGGTLGVWLLANLSPHHLGSLAVACILASVFQVLKQEGSTARTSYNLSWAVYGAAFAGLGVPEAFATILVAHLVEWIWHRYPWYIQSFNIGSFAITASVSGLTFTLVGGLPGPLQMQEVLALLAAMAVFTLVNHLLVGWVIQLARGQSLAQSGVFTFTTLMIDFGLLCLGISAALINRNNPLAVVFVLVVTYLLYSVLRLPALERKSEQDGKTGLYNDEYFERALQRELLRSQKLNRPLCVVMADLDHLRHINNIYGHLAGDAVLKKIARILQATARNDDVVARFGGEEFAILMPNTRLDEAVAQVELMRKTIEAAEFVVSTNATPIKATMSFGVAEREGAEQSSTEFVCNADLAVYRAKHLGRNRTCVHGEEWHGPTDAVIPATVQPPVVEEEVAEDTTAYRASVPIWPALTDTRETEPAAPASTQEPEPAPPGRWVNAYVGLVALAALAMALLLVQPTAALDWRGLLIFAILAFVLEVFSTTIYARDTTVSTSVAPLVAGTLLFGPVGALVLSLVITGASQFKQSKPINRFIFNAGNHLLGSLLCAAVVAAAGVPFLTWSVPLQIVFTVSVSLLIYLSTTVLLAGVVGLNTRQPFVPVWIERFRWLSLHYLALGLIAYALLFNYQAAGLAGIVLMLIPLAMLQGSQRQYIIATKNMADRLRKTNEELVKRTEEVDRLNQELMLALASTIDLRDPFVIEHSRHVARYAALTATELGMPPQRVELVHQAGLMHDIGKLAIPEAILFKPDFITPEEYAIVKEHSTIGADLLSGFSSLRDIATFVRHHHERYDGRGYPEGLSGAQIPLEARILALADAVEAMASDRPYRQGLSVEAILAEVEQNAGTQFDPQVVSAFARVVRTHGPGIIVNSARNLYAQDEYAPDETSGRAAEVASPAFAPCQNGDAYAPNGFAGPTLTTALH